MRLVLGRFFSAEFLRVTVQRLHWLLCLKIDRVLRLLFVLYFWRRFVLKIVPVTSKGSEIGIVPKALNRLVLAQAGLGHILGLPAWVTSAHFLLQAVMWSYGCVFPSLELTRLL